VPREDQGLGNKETPRQINDLIIKETFAADHHRGCTPWGNDGGYPHG